METISVYKVSMETKPAALTDHIGYWLRLVSNHVSGAFAQKLAGRKITVVEWVVLRELYDNDQAPSGLAEKLDLTRGAVTKIADRLSSRKLLARRASATDGRAQLLALSPRGRELVPQLAALADRNDTEFFGMLSPGDRIAFETLLQQIISSRGLRGMPKQ